MTPYEHSVSGHYPMQVYKDVLPAILSHWVYQEHAGHSTVVQYHFHPTCTTDQCMICHSIVTKQLTGNNGELFSSSPNIQPTALRMYALVEHIVTKLSHHKSTPGSYCLAPYNNSGALYHLKQQHNS